MRNQGYHIEHNFSFGERYMSLTVFCLMMFASLLEQLQELCYTPYREVRKMSGSKKESFEINRGAFGPLSFIPWRYLYRLILAGP